MSRQRIVVLGATGFIGRRLVAELAASDWATPIAAARRPGIMRDTVEEIRLDATDERALGSALASADGVVSCIAGSAQDIVRGGNALLNVTARAASPPRVVFLSSIAAYGRVSGTVNEDSLLLGDIDPYSASKAAVDQRCADYPYVVRLRPGIVYGPGSPWWTDRIARLLVGRRLGNLGIRGQGLCNLVHLEDVVTAVQRSLTRPEAAGQAFNLGSPAPPTWNEYFARYAQWLGAAPVRNIGAGRVRLELDVLGPLLKIAEQTRLCPRRLADWPAIRPWLIDLCQLAIRMEVSKAQARLGLQWRPLEQGLEECATWFLQGGRTR